MPPVPPGSYAHDKYNMYVKINVLLLCAWPFKLDVGDWGISVLVNLRTQLISYCWYYELQIKKFTCEISAKISWILEY